MTVEVMKTIKVNLSDRRKIFIQQMDYKEDTDG